MKKDSECIQYQFEEVSHEEMKLRAKGFYIYLNKRRTIRDFSTKTFPKEIIEDIIKTAATGPSGANKQPYTYIVVDNPEIKKKIRTAAEEEEKKFYENEATKNWRNDLAHLGTDWEKPFLEEAPYLIVVFKQNYGLDKTTGEKSTHYYVNESTGISIGILITAIYNAGLCSLTHTPAPMSFITKLLNRPENEKPVVILPVGYAAENVKVPDIKRKNIDEILVWNKGD